MASSEYVKMFPLNTIILIIPSTILYLPTYSLHQQVSYTKLRTKQKIITPRFTATFGKDDTGVPDSAYPVKPKVIPPVLDQLRQECEYRSHEM